MNKTYYEEHYKSGILTDCFPVNLQRIAFVLKDLPVEDDDEGELEDLPTRVVIYLPDKNEHGGFGTLKWEHTVMDLRVSAATKWVVCDHNFEVDEPIQGTGWYSIPKNERGHLAKGMVNIAGNVYAYGMVRSVFKRKGVKKWKNITTEKKHPNLYADIDSSNDTFVGEWVGFSAMDGFSKHDIYAGGNRGDCWHYDGEQWRRIDLPINADISTIICAKDDKVYIACRNGPVLMGRGDYWETIDKSNQLSHGAWFDGNIYFVGDSGRVYTHYKGENALSEATFKSEMPDWIGNNIVGIASCEECLVAYSEVQAYAYDGEIWHEIIELPSLSKHT